MQQQRSRGVGRTAREPVRARAEHRLRLGEPRHEGARASPAAERVPHGALRDARIAATHALGRERQWHCRRRSSLRERQINRNAAGLLVLMGLSIAAFAQRRREERLLLGNLGQHFERATRIHRGGRRRHRQATATGRSGSQERAARAGLCNIHCRRAPVRCPPTGRDGGSCFWWPHRSQACSFETERQRQHTARTVLGKGATQIRREDTQARGTGRWMRVVCVGGVHAFHRRARDKDARRN